MPEDNPIQYGPLAAIENRRAEKLPGFADSGIAE